MNNWLPAIVSFLALSFTIFSFWWMNWRPGKLQVGSISHFSAGKATEGAFGQPNVVVIGLPLILSNVGARPLIVESLRLVGRENSDFGTLEFERTDTALISTSVDRKIEGDYFFLPLALKPNEIIKNNFVFERRTAEFSYGKQLYRLCLEAKINGFDNWRKIKNIELDFRNEDSISVFELNTLYHVYHYLPRKKA